MTDNKSHRTLLVLNGHLGSKDCFAAGVGSHGYGIATDGALRRCLDLEIPIDTVIGDLDSLPLSSEEIRSSGIEVIEKPDQNKCDLEKALEYLVASSRTLVDVIGFEGGRFDHTVHNLQVMSRFAKKIDFEIYSSFGMTEFVLPDRKYELEGEPGEILSILPLPSMSSVTSSGLRYELEDDDLTWNQFSSLSNEFLHEQAMIKFSDGIGMIYRVFAS